MSAETRGLAAQNGGATGSAWAETVAIIAAACRNGEIDELSIAISLAVPVLLARAPAPGRRLPGRPRYRRARRPSVSCRDHATNNVETTLAFYTGVRRARDVRPFENPACVLTDSRVKLRVATLVQPWLQFRAHRVHQCDAHAGAASIVDPRRT